MCSKRACWVGEGWGPQQPSLTATLANAARLAQVLPAVHTRDDHRHTDTFKLGQAPQQPLATMRLQWRSSTHEEDGSS